MHLSALTALRRDREQSRSDRIRSSAPILSSSMSSCSFVFILTEWIPEKEFLLYCGNIGFRRIGFYLNSLSFTGIFFIYNLKYLLSGLPARGTRQRLSTRTQSLYLRWAPRKFSLCAGVRLDLLISKPNGRSFLREQVDKYQTSECREGERKSIW